MKRKCTAALAAFLCAAMMTGCGDISHVSITPVSREDGSGTRGAFVELFGIQEKNEAGDKLDMTTDMAEITNSTAVMLMTVTGNKNAIGYISMGSMNDAVKTLEIDGVEATFENIKNGSYKIARPFNIATKADASPATQDFINFILSQEGQAVVEESGYISRGNTGVYTPSEAKGNVVVSGSSSVAPVMEKIKEAYEAVNPNVSIEMQQSDSTIGMNSLKEDMCDIGMASRELKESELEAGLIPTVIAMDGIAIIVNHENPLDDMSSEEVKNIFKGEIKEWAEL
ncbi:substrate-binding domain-containing protein [Anaerotignum sp.]|nr:substrate-binding domain-containing protein [Anaerotignum sp.]MBQ7758503.1 substrate-binding domain-containing protein [Anaerotignum sp.]